MIEATREIKDQKTTENGYYLASLAPNAEIAAQAVRNHWGVENSLHWSLDVTFREDDSRVHVGHASEKLALVRKMTHNLIQQETSLNRGIKTKRLAAALDDSYLLKVLGVSLNIY